MRLFSYIVSNDTGFAPNPFRGYCTLACCKPVIRRTAQLGDWVVGLSKRSQGNRLVYAMKVTVEPLTYDEYFSDPRFAKKKPIWSREDEAGPCGDNIYEPDGKGDYIQLISIHSMGGKEKAAFNRRRDLSGRKVLASRHFYYFGANAIALPRRLEFLITGRGHRCTTAESDTRVFLKFIGEYRRGVHGQPHKWPPRRDRTVSVTKKTCG